MAHSGGVVLGRRKRGRKEEIYYVGGDTHTLCIGATRSGKTRSVVLQSIGLTALSGESLIVSDPKGELHQYTYPFLERLGYRVLCLDFKNPLKGHRYNFLQNVIDAIHAGDIPQAVDSTWDITSTFVGEAKGERIWTDGEASTIASAILSVAIDNKDNPQYQNLTNVYHFIANMCKGSGTNIPMNKYMDTLPETHPARALLGISDVAPSRTRGSFFTAALTNLRLFTNALIADMTSESDFAPASIGREKAALFIILPDEKTTYYTLASLMVSQVYEALCKEADARGGRLMRRVLFLLDEFGNFAPISGMSTKLTVGGGRGIRFAFFIQGLAMLTEKYGKEVASIIQDNCETWIYLQADGLDTLETLSKKLGQYTVSVQSESNSYGRHSQGSKSQSTNLTGRSLMTPDEIRLISRPYSLVTSRNHPAILQSLDLSQWYFNRMFGMGDMEHNRLLREEREARRPQRPKNVEVPLWGIWKDYQQQPGMFGRGGFGFPPMNDTDEE
ncbi:type IV secretory system conjugative DNA transfer family protein [Eubacteriales bacterium OttesenSCG-928-M02]|nr:type IV secretory system conjugative DNA transfer family protein [Eubacteriales bacterium OttesenSCG-928-M02]